jgi:hypothetical protein
MSICKKDLVPALASLNSPNGGHVLAVSAESSLRPMALLPRKGLRFVVRGLELLIVQERKAASQRWMIAGEWRLEQLAGGS